MEQDHKHTALIIEDEYLLAIDLENILEDLGFNVIGIATTEDDAVKAALHHRPDLITADIMLRKGTGIRAVQRISRRHQTCVLYVTGDEEMLRSSTNQAMCVAKPFGTHSIARAIKQSMGWVPCHSAVFGAKSSTSFQA